uniref:Uncharacterized protein n=1 Tax=Caenorhabditis japonica TaxID=281687 RepID=A0A8R1HZC2_CAEJA
MTTLVLYIVSDFKCPPNEEFKGFYDEANFITCVLMQLTFGLTLILVSALPQNILTSAIAFLTILTCNRWLKTHGVKMTRKQVVFFEVRNLLEVDPPRFRFGMEAVSDECLTPGDGVQRAPEAPQTLWDALFTDETEMRMQKFYREHYGGVYAKGVKMLKELEGQKDKSSTHSQHSQHSHKHK